MFRGHPCCFFYSYYHIIDVYNITKMQGQTIRLFNTVGSRVSHSGVKEYGGKGVPHHPMIFFEKPPSKTNAPHGASPHLKMKSPPSEKQTPPPAPLKSEAFFQKIIPRKKPWKIGNCHWYLCFNHSATLEKSGRNSTRTWFSHLGHSNFCKKSETAC